MKQFKIFLATGILMWSVFGVLFAGSFVAAKNNPVQASLKDMEKASSLSAREKAVAAKEKELAQRGEQLAALNAEFDEKLIRLGKLQDNLEQQLSELKAIKGKRFKNLISVYSTMSASKVAPLLNSMDDSTVAEILRAMKTDTVAKIMPKLDPEKAVRVSRSMGLLTKQ